jgi:hypothetical protein
MYFQPNVIIPISTQQNLYTSLLLRATAIEEGMIPSLFHEAQILTCHKPYKKKNYQPISLKKVDPKKSIK